MLKKLAFLTLLAVAAAALIRILRPRPDFAMPAEGNADWPPLDLPGPDSGASASNAEPQSQPSEANAEPAEDTGGWVEPNDDGSCPEGFPIKVKLSSGIFHVPGGLSYERTKPDRCYATPGAAENDGFRQSQR